MKARYITGLTATDKDTYLLKITSEENFPTRKDIVSWCKEQGLIIAADAIFIRNNVIRVKVIEGSIIFKPASGLIQALRDDSPECMLAELGDEVQYLDGGLRALGTVKNMSGGLVTIVNADSNETDNYPLTVIMKVQGSKVAEAAAVNPEQMLKAALKLD